VSERASLRAGVTHLAMCGTHTHVHVRAHGICTLQQACGAQRQQQQLMQCAPA
jgi:hypothetical protein